MTYATLEMMRSCLDEQAVDCRKCGGANELDMDRAPGSYGVYWYTVCCVKCGGWKSTCSATPQEAISKWNKKNLEEKENHSRANFQFGQNP